MPIFRLSLVALFTLLLQGCYFLQKASVPIQVDYFSAVQPTSSGPKALMILLPGIGDDQTAFYKHGFVADVQQLWPTMEIAAVNGHFAYYQNRSIVDRLVSDVVTPARQRGIERFYFAGISLGGFGSLLYQRDTDDDLAGIILLAPYLGEETNYQYLLSGGAPPDPLTEDNIWPWLQKLPPEVRQRIYLGYGAQDKFAEANALLAKWLPEQNVSVIPGKHNWKTWRPLWQNLLQAIPKT